MSNNQKRYFHIDRGTSTDQILTLLDTVSCDNKDEIDKFISDSYTEFKAPEEMELTGNLDNARVLTPEANVHVADEGTTYTEELEINKKRKNPGENTLITRKCNVSRRS